MATSVDHRNWSETAVFELAKYSKSSARTDLSAQSNSTVSRPATPLEWSHFTQSGLSLVVETVHVDSKTQSNQIGTRHQEIILKIIWDNNPGLQKANSAVSRSTDRPGVFLLESVNLTQVQEKFGHSRLAGESALKAYSIDAVVGIRYATGQLTNSFIFNRIQIKLQKPGDPIRLIAIIEAICPCKISSKSHSSKSSRNSLSTNSNSLTVGHSSSQPSLETDTNNRHSQAFYSQTQLETESSQSSSRRNLSQLPININSSTVGHSSSQPSVEIDSNNQIDSQAFFSQSQLPELPRPSRRNLSQIATTANLSTAGHSRLQPSIEIGTSSETGSCNKIGHTEPTSSSESCVDPLPSIVLLDHQARKSPTSVPLENSHSLSSNNSSVLPEKFEEMMTDLSDETLMKYAREVCMEPGFDDLVHRIHRFIHRID